MHPKVKIVHVFFWAVYSSFFIYHYSHPFLSSSQDFIYVVLDILFQIGGVVLISYINYFFFLDELLKSKKLFTYLLKFVPTFAMLGYGFILIKREIVEKFLNENSYVFTENFVTLTYFNILSIVVFTSLLKLFENWWKVESQKKELQNKHLVAELQFLRGQINPHFLFNTLNNLYYLAYTKSDTTVEVIEKLSDMMRYMLYDCSATRTPLEKELKFLEDYVALERLRIKDGVEIDFRIEGLAQDLIIAPFILITFVENAFKHGVSSNDFQSWIKIHLSIEESKLFLSVSNSKFKNLTKSFKKVSGIGLSNVKKRLELDYGKNYSLSISEKPETFNIRLIIKLETSKS